MNVGILVFGPERTYSIISKFQNIHCIGCLHTYLGASNLSGMPVPILNIFIIRTI